jgi:hypothetical protein
VTTSAPQIAAGSAVIVSAGNTTATVAVTNNYQI